MARLLAVSASTLLLALACASPSGEPAAPGPDAFDPRAMELMAAVCERAAAQTSFRMELTDVAEEQLPSGQTVQLEHRRTLTVRRPDRLMAITEGDQRRRTLWKDGSSITLADHDHQVYATLPDPGSIDDMVDMLFDQYGISTPLADLISADPYAVFMDGALSASYLGLHQVRGARCHHLAIQRPELDFQVWLDEDDTRLRKLSINYKHLPGQPTFTLFVEASEALMQVPDAAFMPDLPEGYEAIDLLPLLPAGEQ